jgi:polyphosphate kinase
VPGLSDNVRVVSVVGRFLEHSRIYYFRNAGEEEYYIGSADCMSRNLESRVEVLVPVESRENQKELRFLLNALLEDTRSAWQMRPDGGYARVEPKSGEAVKSVHEILAERARKQLFQVNRLKRRGSKSRPQFPSD